MKNLASIISILFLFSGCVPVEDTGMKSLETVSNVDLTRYAGRWYEIARFPHRFQRGCVASRATYELRDDGKINVTNECFEKSPSGKMKSVNGKAWVVDRESNAKLKVSFFWPFAGDYWIIDLDRDYEYAVVGHPSRKYLWILSRSPGMSEKIYNEILDRLEKQDYDTTKLLLSVQLEK